MIIVVKIKKCLNIIWCNISYYSIVTILCFYFNNYYSTVYCVLIIHILKLGNDSNFLAMFGFIQYDSFISYKRVTRLNESWMNLIYSN